jgi:antirestriction protein ArdC
VPSKLINELALSRHLLVDGPGEDHASYLAHWLEILREDKRAIFSAAAHAQRAVDFLHSLGRARERR